MRPLLATLTRLGMPLYGCQSPDGYKNTEDVWLNPDALAQRISFATALGLGRFPLGKVIDDGIANDPYARNATEPAADLAADRAGSDAGTPLYFTALLATLGDKISPEARTRIAAVDPPTLRAALVLGGPDFHAPLTCLGRRNMNRRKLLQAMIAAGAGTIWLGPKCMGQDL